MATFSGLEIGLSFVCGCVILGCAAEVYYLLYCRNKRIDIENQKSSFSSCSSNFTPTHLSCRKTSNSSNPTKTQENYQDSDMGMVQDPVLNDSDEESLDLELMRLHNLHGPPRFLTTINEETKEDLESQRSRSRKGSRTKSLSDFFAHFDTPQASPPIKGSQLLDFESFQCNGLNMNPLFENDVKNVKSSPPPTFKFLRDAEEKLLRRLKELEDEKGVKFGAKVEDINGSFVNLSGSEGKNGRSLMVQQNHQISVASKVIPLT